MKVLAMILLAIRNHGFSFAELVQHDDELASLDLLNFTRQKIADAARELVANLCSLAFANALNDSLLCGKYGHATEFREINGLLEYVTNLELRIFVAGFLEGN